MNPLAAAQTRQPQRRVPGHASTIPAPRHRQDDRAAKRPELGRPHPYRHRDLSIVTSAKLPDPHPANTRRPIRTAIRRREPRLADTPPAPTASTPATSPPSPVASTPSRTAPPRRGVPHHCSRPNATRTGHPPAPPRPPAPRAAKHRDEASSRRRPVAAPVRGADERRIGHRPAAPSPPGARAPHNRERRRPITTLCPPSRLMMAHAGDSSTANARQTARTPNQGLCQTSRTSLDPGNIERKDEPGASAATLDAISSAGR